MGPFPVVAIGLNVSLGAGLSPPFIGVTGMEPHSEGLEALQAIHHAAAIGTHATLSVATTDAYHLPGRQHVNGVFTSGPRMRLNTEAIDCMGARPYGKADIAVYKGFMDLAEAHVSFRLPVVPREAIEQMHLGMAMAANNGNKDADLIKSLGSWVTEMGGSMIGG